MAEMQEIVPRDRVEEVQLVTKLVGKKVLQNLEEGILPERAEVQETAKWKNTPIGKPYVTDLIAGHSIEDEKWKFKVRCYGVASTDDTGEHTEDQHRTSVKRCLMKMHIFEWSSHEMLDLTAVR